MPMAPRPSSPLISYRPSLVTSSPGNIGNPSGECAARARQQKSIVCRERGQRMLTRLTGGFRMRLVTRLGIALTLAVLLSGIAIAAPPPSPEQQVRAVLDAQVAAWNRGDLAAFM